MQPIYVDFLNGPDIAALDLADEDILGAIGLIWTARGDRYSELRSSVSAKAPLQTAASAERRVEMHYIGG